MSLEASSSTSCETADRTFLFDRSDPYPHLEPLMEKFDVLAEENRAFEHINSGFMWMRKSQATADAWNEVLEMDLRETSRDQYNFNTVSSDSAALYRSVN